MNEDPFVKRLRLLLTLTGLDAANLSRRAQLAQAHVGMVLRGEVRRPGPKTLSAICGVCGASLDWLVDGKGEPPTAEVARQAVEKHPLPSRDSNNKAA